MADGVQYPTDVNIEDVTSDDTPPADPPVTDGGDAAPVEPVTPFGTAEIP